MADYIYRAVVSGGGSIVTNITYHNSNGQNISYRPSNRCWAHATGTNPKKTQDAALLFNTINKYFTPESPNITLSEQVEIRADIAKARPPISGVRNDINGCGGELLDIYGGVDFVLNTFSADESEGGKNITPNEVYRIYEIFHRWTR